jgi:pimeloyl-ACP methyl ester carboxylesterase
VLRYWGRFKKPVLVLHSEKDEFIPPGGDQVALNKRYREANPSAVSNLSGLIPGTGHTVLDEEGRQWLSDRVALFLETL